MRYLLDTNVLSEAARPQPEPRVVEWLRSQPATDLGISVLTLGEIGKGVALLPAGARREALERWVAADVREQFAGRVLDIDHTVALAWGRLAAEGRRQGREPPVIDGLLLATAATHHLIFVTRNTDDCEGRGVPVLNPWND